MVKKTILTDKPHNLIKKYRSLLEKKGIKVEKIILFGSYAKNKAKPLIEPHPYSPKDLANPFDPLAHQINKKGKVIE